MEPRELFVAFAPLVRIGPELGRLLAEMCKTQPLAVRGIHAWHSLASKAVQSGESWTIISR
jgi:hypothetical protein